MVNWDEYTKHTLLTIVATQCKEGQRHVRRLLMRIKASINDV